MPFGALDAAVGLFLNSYLPYISFCDKIFQICLPLYVLICNTIIAK